MKTYISFLVSVFATFCLLSYMWVSAAQADTGCRKLDNGVTMCEGSAVSSLTAPRGTVRRLPRVSTHTAPRAERIGQTVIIARLGARI